MAHIARRIAHRNGHRNDPRIFSEGTFTYAELDHIKNELNFGREMVCNINFDSSSREFQIYMIQPPGIIHYDDDWGHCDTGNYLKIIKTWMDHYVEVIRPEEIKKGAVTAKKANEDKADIKAMERGATQARMKMQEDVKHQKKAAARAALTE